MNPFDDFEKSVTFDSKYELIAALEQSGIDDSVSAAMLEGLEETDEPVHNVMFISTDGHYAIKAIHVPASAIDGVDGPVLFPTSNPKTIIAAFSKEHIQNKMQLIEELEPGLRDDAWIEFLELLTEKVTLECESNPPLWKDL